MIKNTIFALLASAALIGVAVPANAASSLTGSFASQDNGGYSEWDAEVDLTKLRQNGVNAVSVEDWNGYLRAFVADEAGHQTMQYFNKDTLAPINNL